MFNTHTQQYSQNNWRPYLKERDGSVYFLKWQCSLTFNGENQDYRLMQMYDVSWSTRDEGGISESSLLCDIANWFSEGQGVPIGNPKITDACRFRVLLGRQGMLGKKGRWYWTAHSPHSLIQLISHHICIHFKICTLVVRRSLKLKK